MAVYKLTFSAANWTLSESAMYYDTVSQAFYRDEDCTIPITAIDIPKRELYRFDGFKYSTTPVIDEKGNITSDAYGYAWNAARSLSIQSTQVSYKLTLNDNGGAHGDAALYYDKLDGTGFYADDQCTVMFGGNVSLPDYSGKVFSGYHNAQNAASPGKQYFDENGDATPDFYDLTLTGAKTIYAQWKDPLKVTISANSGSGGDVALYYDTVFGRFYESLALLEAVTKIRCHVRECFELLGYFASNNTTSDRRIAADGTIDPEWQPAAATTIYCQWSRVSWDVVLDKRSGGGGDSKLYYKLDGGGYHADSPCTTPADRVVPPTRTNYVFKGYFSATTNGTKYINSDGTFTDDFMALQPLAAAKTIYSQWEQAWKATLNKKGGSGGTDAIWYSVTNRSFYSDSSCTVLAPSVTPPTKECKAFAGYFSAQTGGTKYIDADGTYTSSLSSLAANKVFYAQWTDVSLKAELDANGGSGGAAAFYYDGTNLAFYADDQLAPSSQISSVDVPTRDGYDFIGFYDSRSGGSRYVDEAGNIVVATVPTAGVKLYARWSARQYVLSFDNNGGSGTAEPKQVTFAAAIGTLPAPTRENAVFGGWYVGGQSGAGGSVVGGELIDAASRWQVPSDATAIASWITIFGSVVDYFGLSSAALIPISSVAGDCRNHSVATNGGKIGATHTGGVLRNPSVTYLVVADTTVSTFLGKAFPARNDGGVTVSGYMLTRVRVDTRTRSFPTVVVESVANEGQAAINRFNVSIPVMARARAQNLLNALDASGLELVGVSIDAECDPVVLYENLMPCASDVVRGRCLLHAEVRAQSYGVVPSVASSFALVDAPRSFSHDGYLSYTLEARKALA